VRKTTIVFLYLGVFFVPLEYLLVVLVGYDNPLKPYRIFIIMSVLSFMAYILVGRKAIRVDIYDRVFFTIFAYGFLVALIKFEFFNQGNLTTTYNDIQLIILGFLSFIVIKNMGLTVSEIRRILTFYFVAVSINVIFVIYSAFVLQSFLRTSGFYRNPNHAAQAIVLLILFIIYVMAQSRNHVNRLIVTFVPLGLALFFTGSRAAIFSLIIALPVWYLLSRKRSIVKAIFISSVSIMLVSAVQFATDNLEIGGLMDRYDLNNMEISGGSGRIDIWESGLNLAGDHAYIGVGMSQYSAYHHEYIRQLSDVYQTVLNYDLGLHSDYFSMLVEYGVIGLLLYLFIVYLVLRRTFPKRGQQRSFAVFFFVALGTIFFQGFFQVSYMLPTYWLMFGLAVSHNRIYRKGRPQCVH
jgi:O-antigen ligase